MIKYLFLFLLSFNTLLSVGQTQLTEINPNQFDEEYLNALIIKEVNILRKKHKINGLIYQSAAAKAAENQAKYVVETGKLTHIQPSSKYKTVLDRLEINTTNLIQTAGENIAQTHVIIPTYTLKSDGSKEIQTDTTYENLAKTIVKIWIDSPPHFKNCIHPSYIQTGVACKIDPKDLKVIAVQVFTTIQSN